MKTRVLNTLRTLGFLDDIRGFSPIYRDKELAFPFPPNFSTYKTAYGFYFCGDALDLTEPMASGHYDSELAETLLILRLLPSINCFVDIGANIGFFSLLAAAQGRQRIRVIACEPASSNFKKLSAAIGANALEDLISPHHLAIGEAKGHANLHLYSFGSGGHSLKPAPGMRPFSETEQVELDTLDNLQAQHKISEERTLLKIDVEGGEHQVFAGATQWLKSSKPPIVLFEAWPASKDDPRTNHIRAVSFLQNLGYQLYVINKVTHNVCPIAPLTAGHAFKASSSGNYLALPSWALPSLNYLSQPVDMRIFSDTEQLRSLNGFLLRSLEALQRHCTTKDAS
jgi:FkbM family methyltransferase